MAEDLPGQAHIAAALRADWGLTVEAAPLGSGKSAR
jgi:hypothetical protein